MRPDLDRFLVPPTASIKEAITCIDRNAKGIALVVDAERRLLGTVTDGDIRRAILSGTNLNLPVQLLLEKRAHLSYPSPVTAPAGTSHEDLVVLMNRWSLRHVPLVNEADQVVDLAVLNELVQQYELPFKALIMAGGFGTRLRPLTEKLPKPMLPVGGRPLLEHLIAQLRQCGVRQVNVATHYKAEVITNHFGDGSGYGVQIRYVEEGQPLGTAGALSLFEGSNQPLLVINGDILTRVDLRAMYEFHQDHQGDMTVGVRQYEVQVPYGVIEIDGIAIKGMSEKPVLRHFINTGIYLVNPQVCRYVPVGKPYNMPDLIHSLLADERRVLGFPVREFWIDLGQPGDYEKAIAELEKGELERE